MKGLAIVVAAGGAIALGVALASGASPTPFEQVQAARKHIATAKAEIGVADSELAAVETALKPKEEAPPPTGEQKTWAPANTARVPLSDAQASACVTHKPEVHADNTTFNAYVPTDSELSSFHTTAASFSPLSKYVTGRPGLSAPSTDDLIQWGACKWGIPTDTLRAEYVIESNWHQLECAGNVACNSTGGPSGAGLVGKGFGDCAGSGSGPPASINASGCNPGVYTSVGITQVKEQACCHPGTFPLAWKSTAFNIDYQASIVRYYFDGLAKSWLSCDTPGQEWFSIGSWFSPNCSGGSADYIKKVQAALAEKRWAQAGF